MKGKHRAECAGHSARLYFILSKLFNGLVLGIPEKTAKEYDLLCICFQYYMKHKSNVIVLLKNNVLYRKLAHNNKYRHN